MLFDIGQCKIGIALGLRRTLDEIGKGIGGDEVVISQHAL